ncbi:DUF6287 domain-containing protein [Streptococcus suis]|uniref:DUF6287 domain-containing protein n=1 Tax=Streptococcus suis TaxID=1307 RepID=UPI001C974DD2|nr:DUF6287 domain-containing protein [Streptococcus suis]MBY5009674.1 DUF6287 domain-containing protein [Streptococcus suis]MDG4517848.1 DUF6287 domain-containing protein [Streptococcus suis]
MTEKEWVSYFETINGRKPSKVELKLAFQRGEIRKRSYWFRIRRIPVWQQILVLLTLILLLYISYKPALKFYYQSQESRYEDLYKRVISDYQEAILQKDSEKVNVDYFNQPTRFPSYLIDDLDSDGKTEMYIGFDDGEDNIEVLEQFDISFGKVEKVKPKLNVSSEKNWYPFDVKGLYQINLIELSNQDFSSVNDVWITEDNTHNIRIYNDGIAYIDDQRTDNLPSGGGGIPGDRFGFLNTSSQYYEGYSVSDPVGGKISLTALTNLGIHYTYEFIPKGIDSTQGDIDRDRLIVHTFDEKIILYRSSDIFSSVVKNNEDSGPSIDFTELLRGDFSSLAGTWKNSLDSFTIDETGSMEGDFINSSDIAIRELKIMNEAYLDGIYGDSNTDLENANTGQYITIIPSGITVRGEIGTDSNRDRIALGGRMEGLEQGNIYYKVE